MSNNANELAPFEVMESFALFYVRTATMKRSRIFVSLAPLYIFSKLCGFADFHIDSGGRFVFSDKLLKYSSTYHALMVLLLFYVLAVTKDQIIGSTSTTLVMFNAAGLTLLFILNKIYQKVYAKTKIATLWKSLVVMENQVAALNMQLKHKQIGVQSALSFLPTQVFLTCLVAGQYYVSITMSSSATTPMVFAVILYLIETERTVITGQFCSLLIIIGDMFTTLAENIRENNVQTKFRFLAIYHHDLCKSIRKTNTLYSIHLALSFGVDFVCFVTYTQLIAYDLLQGKVTKIGGLSMAWMVVLCSRILPIITVSHSCMHSVIIIAFICFQNTYFFVNRRLMLNALCWKFGFILTC